MNLFKKKEELWICFIENPEIKNHWGFLLFKLLIKGTAVNLFETKKSCRFLSLKMVKQSTLDIYFGKTTDKSTAWNLFKIKKTSGFILFKSLKDITTRDLFCWNFLWKLRLWIYFKKVRAVDISHWKSRIKVAQGIYFVERLDKRYGW